jgi:hypothetical protein
MNGASDTRRNAALEILTGRARADTPLANISTGFREIPAPQRPARVAGGLAMSEAGPRPLPSSRRRDAVRGGARATLLRAVLLTVGAALLVAAGFQLRATIDTPAADIAPSTTAISAAAAELTVALTSPLPEPALPSSASLPVPASAFGVLLDERFSSNARKWPTDPQGAVRFADASYRLSAREAARFVAVGIPGTENLSDTVVTAWLRKVGGPSGGGYGLMVRDRADGPRDGQYQSGHYYVFEVGDRGEVGVWLRDGEQWVDLLTWTASDAVHPGTAANELTVTAIGDRLSFLVNGIPVASQTDTILHTGAAGIFVGGDGNEVALDRVVVRTPR